MFGLGETDDEILQVVRDPRSHDVEMLTLAQHLPPASLDAWLVNGER